jgi:hypothetical protein
MRGLIKKLQGNSRVFFSKLPISSQIGPHRSVIWRLRVSRDGAVGDFIGYTGKISHPVRRWMVFPFQTIIIYL